MLQLLRASVSQSSPVVLKLLCHIVISIIRNTESVLLMQFGQIEEQVTYEELFLKGAPLPVTL